MSNGMLGEGIALAEIAGPIGDLLEKLGGADGATWLEAFKRFLRKETTWPRPAEDIRTDKVTALIAQDREVRRALLSILPTMFFSRREAEILKLWFGFEEKSVLLEDIALRQGVTRERVRQLKERALRRFGRMLALVGLLE